MSKQLNDDHRSTMDTYPSVGRFNNDHKVSLHTKGSSAKFSDFDRHKSMEPPRTTVPVPSTSHHQPSPPTRPATDIVDLRSASGNGWKVTNPASPNHSTQRHCMWYNQNE